MSKIRNFLAASAGAILFLFAQVHASSAVTFSSQTLTSLGLKGDASNLGNVTVFNGKTGDTINGTYKTFPNFSIQDWQTYTGDSSLKSTDFSDGVLINYLIRQVVLTPGGDSNVTFNFSDGKFRFSHPLTACGVNLNINGTADRSTILAFSQFDSSNQLSINIDAIRFCVDQNPLNTQTAKVSLKDLNILGDLVYGTPVSASTTAIKLIGKYPPSGSDFYKTAANLFNVNVINFGNCLDASYLSNTTVSQLSCNSGISTETNAKPIAGTGMKFIGNGDFVVHIYNSGFMRYNTAIEFEAQGSGGFEDVLVKDINIGASKSCVKIGALNTDGTPNPNYSPLQYTIKNMACSATSGFVEAQAAGHLNIEGGTWLVWTPAGRVPAANNDWVATGADFFKFCRVENGILRDAWVSADGQPISFNSYVYVKGDNETDAKCASSAASIDVRLLHNKFSYFNLGSVQNLIYVGHNANGTQAYGNTFSNYFNHTGDPPLNTQTVDGSGNPTGHYVTAFAWNTTDPNASLEYKPAGERIPLTSSTTGVTSGTETVIGTATLTPGVWTCKGTGSFLPSTNMTLSQYNFYLSTVAPPVYRPPGDVMLQDFNKTFLQPVSIPLAGRTFDFTNKNQTTTIYLSALANYSSGSLQSNAVVDCTRTR